MRLGPLRASVWPLVVLAVLGLLTPHSDLRLHALPMWVLVPVPEFPLFNQDIVMLD